MANKYIIHGAAYNGDGTSSSEATSNGGVGAWNTITYFEGTTPAYGTLAAGDIVYIRSKDASGQDITRTLTASLTLGSSVATSNLWLTWVIDGGTVWSGIDGKLQYDCASTYAITFRNYHYYRAENPDKFVVREANINSDYKKIVAFPTIALFDNLFIDCSSNTYSTGNYTNVNGGEDKLVFKNLHLKWANHLAAPFSVGQWGRTILINPQIELTTSDADAGVFDIGEFGAHLMIYGGRVFGKGATTGNCLVRLYGISGRGNGLTAVGLQVPRTMTLVNNPVNVGPWKVEAIGMDSGMGASIEEGWGSADSRTDGYYPTLNAFFPDSSNTPWSWKIYPARANMATTMCLPVAKVYTEDATVKQITAYFLLADSITTANKETMWLDISYIDDSTGSPTSISTKDFSAASLDSSDANWTATTYGAINLLKKQLSVTTPTSVKKDTPIVVTLLGYWSAASALDIMFFCPDVSLS